MDDSTADGLRGAGALLVGVSLALPWYSVHAGEALTSRLGSDIALDSASGWEALGALRWVLLALVVAAGLRGLVSEVVPKVAALGLLLVVGFRWTAPPSATSLLAGKLPDTGSGLGDAFGQSVIDAFTSQLGLELRPASGMALAALGTALALAGALGRTSVTVSAPARVPARP